ncbi:hypothetical protein HMPREF2615_09775 [Pseudomonas aeruginosa]|nr:hypothetical protein HMPREF2615_09775 [Pseudomonas aeruginosa]
MSSLQLQEMLDGDSDQIAFLNGVTKRATTNGSAASHGPGFLTGTQPPKSRRLLSSGISLVGVFLTQWGAERREGGLLRCPLFFKATHLGPQPQDFALGFQQFAGLFLRLVGGHSLYPFVEAVSRDAEARGDFRD